MRASQHANLPDCRAYEMVSPVDKAGFSVTAGDGSSYIEGNHPRGTTVLLGGDGFAYSAGGAVLDPQSQAGLGIPYRALRTESGWESKPINGPIGPPAPVLLAMGNNPAISTDGSRSLLASPAALTPGAWPCTATEFMCSNSNLYVQDNETLERRLILGWPLDEVVPMDAAYLADATDDLRKVTFTAFDRYAPGATTGSRNLYEWTDDGTARGVLRLVGIDENGDPLAGDVVAGQGPFAQTQVTARTLSADGQRIFFTANGQVYVRQDGTTTMRASASQRATPDPDGPQSATYWTAEAATGSDVFFTSGEKLTDDANATPTAPDLYRFDVARGELTDITATDDPAGVLGVMGSSEDGRTVYFGATAQLVAGKGTAGEANLYRWQDDGTPSGRITFVATVGTVGDTLGHEMVNWANGVQAFVPPSISSDGRFVGFLSVRSLTGADTGGMPQVYRYDGQADQVVCVSCAADGSASTGPSEFRQIERSDHYRVITDAGVVAFQTEQALVAEDVNGKRDVYLYTGGRPHLISTGKDPDLSTYLGMSASGDDVFFATRERLVEQDTDGLSDVYVARVGGGFSVAPTPAPCAGDACQGRAAPDQGLQDPGTSSFVGPGNVLAPPKAPRATKLRKVKAKLSASVDRKRRVTVRVTAPAAGRVRITGSRTARGTRKVSKAGKRSYRVKLTRKATRSLQRHGRLKIRIKVAFTPKSGKGSSKTVARTIKETA
ncbi:MAG: hypothetical protein ITG02_09680 [Patulibacter sp.]|nr:hypothetical protein [Patulibacter sp.]